MMTRWCVCPFVITSGAKLKPIHFWVDIALDTQPIQLHRDFTITFGGQHPPQEKKIPRFFGGMPIVTNEEAEHLAAVMMSRRQPVLMGMRMNCGVSSGSPVLGWMNDTSTDVVNSFLYVEYVNDMMIQRSPILKGW
jgi:hypothetical protein